MGVVWGNPARNVAVGEGPVDWMRERQLAIWRIFCVVLGFHTKFGPRLVRVVSSIAVVRDAAGSDLSLRYARDLEATFLLHWHFEHVSDLRQAT